VPSASSASASASASASSAGSTGPAASSSIPLAVLTGAQQADRTGCFVVTELPRSLGPAAPGRRGAAAAQPPSKGRSILQAYALRHPAGSVTLLQAVGAVANAALPPWPMTQRGVTGGSAPGGAEQKAAAPAAAAAATAATGSHKGADSTAQGSGGADAGAVTLHPRRPAAAPLPVPAHAAVEYHGGDADDAWDGGDDAEDDLDDDLDL
jgi:hypothetical protein